MMKSNLMTGLLGFTLFTGILLSFGCKHYPIYNGEPIVESNCDSNKVYFQNTILPLLNSHCGIPGCHDAITHEADINLTTYSSIMSGGEEGLLVIPYDPGASKLHHIIADGEMPPPPYAQLTPEELDFGMNSVNFEKKDIIKPAQRFLCTVEDTEPH